MPTDDLYADPALYDLEYAHQAEDVVHYLRLAARTAGPILELGCGNGRITVPLARAGCRVHGVDTSADMLDDLRRKLAVEDEALRGRITLSREDFRRLEVAGTYGLVLLPFNALHHCMTHHDVLDLLRGVRDRLAPDGRLALDLYLPDPTLYARDPGQRYEPRDFVDPRTGGRLQSWESGWYDVLQQIHHVRYIYRAGDGPERTVGIDLRMFYPQELRALLDWAGFEILSEAEDFDGHPLRAESLKWVLTLRAR